MSTSPNAEPSKYQHLMPDGSWIESDSPIQPKSEPARDLTEADVIAWVAVQFEALPSDIKERLGYAQLSVVSSRSLIGQPTEIQLMGWPDKGTSFEIAHGQTVAEAVEAMRKHLPNPRQKAEQMRQEAEKLLRQAAALANT